MENGVRSGDGAVVISSDPDAQGDCAATPIGTVAVQPRFPG